MAVRVSVAAALLVGAMPLVACGSGGADRQGHLAFGPHRALYTAPITVGVSGLRAGQTVTLRMSTTDRDGTPWSSSASYRADSSGRVTGSTVPVEGSYRDANPQGLYDSLKPPGTREANFTPPTPWTIRVSLSNGEADTAVATSTITRLLPVQDHLVTVTHLRPADGGLYGELFEPAHPVRGATSVLTFGGSEGGLYYPAQTAAALAAAGHPALALAYFNAPGLPQHLDRIPIEYFDNALRRLGRAGNVDPHRIAVWGVSRGSEAAQLVAVHDSSRVAGVVALVPSDVAYPSLPDGTHAAWTYDGKAVPTSHEFNNPAPTDVPTAVIPVSRFHGPFFMSCGDLDGVWSSCAFANAIRDSLGARASVQTYDSGHLVGLVPDYPSTLTRLVQDGHAIAFGGTPAATANARDDEWPKILAFLDALPRTR